MLRVCSLCIPYCQVPYDIQISESEKVLAKIVRSTNASEADEDDTAENQQDSQPLAAFHALAEEDSREQHGDGAVERCQHGDHGDMAGAETRVIGDEGGGVRQAGEEEQPP